MEELWEEQVRLFERVPQIPPPQPKKPAEAAPKTEKKFKWATSLDSGFKFDFKGTVPVADLSHVEWAASKGVERSETGAEGVFFAETGNGSVVIKGSKTMGGEVFASLVTMHFGIHVPRCRVLKNGSDEATLMLQSLKNVDPSWRVVTNLFDLSYFLIKEFVHGVNLDSLDYETAADIFGDRGEFTENGRKRLRELGALIAVDLLLNNGDRLPTPVWGNQGNAGNVMFSTHLGVVMSVDSQVMAINPARYPEELGQYKSKVETFLRNMIAGGEACTSDLTMVRGIITNYSRYDIHEGGIEEIRQGILDILRHFKEGQEEAFVASLRRWRESLASHQQPPLVGIDAVDVDYVIEVVKVFQALAPLVC